MTTQAPPNSLGAVLRLLEVQSLRGADDQELLSRFAATRDPAAFRVLAERHGPMVLGVCRRVLGCPHDAEDAFQATFLVLSRRAGAIRKGDGLAGWLHGVARHVASRLQRGQRRRQRREQAVVPPPARGPLEEVSWAEVKAGLDEELERLPGPYREVLVLCYLEGLTRDEAAQRLGVAVGVVKGRLERGRKLLADRLAGRGITLSAGLLPVAISSEVVTATVRAAAALAEGGSVGPLVSTSVLSLANEVLKGMAMSKLKGIAVGVTCALVLVAGVGAGLAQEPNAGTTAQPGGTPSAAKPAEPKDTDETFIRRVSRDVRGVEPTPAEVHFFVRSKDAGKRDALVELFIKERAEKKKYDPAATILVELELQSAEIARRVGDLAPSQGPNRGSLQPSGNPLPSLPGESSRGSLGGGDTGGSGKPVGLGVAVLKARVEELRNLAAEKETLLSACRELKKNLNDAGRRDLDLLIDRLEIDAARYKLQLQEAIVNLRVAERAGSGPLHPGDPMGGPGGMRPPGGGGPSGMMMR